MHQCSFSLAISKSEYTLRLLGISKSSAFKPQTDLSNTLATPGYRANPSGRKSTGSAIGLIQVALASVGRQMMASVVSALLYHGHWK